MSELELSALHTKVFFEEACELKKYKRSSSRGDSYKLFHRNTFHMQKLKLLSCIII